MKYNKNQITFKIKVFGGAFLRMLRFSRHFGLSTSLQLFCNDLRKFMVKDIVSLHAANAEHHKIIEKYLETKGYVANLENTDSLERVSLSTNNEKDYIWVCWWQGENSMPEMVRKCYNSIIHHANGHVVKLITFDNYKNYVGIDNRIVEKVKSGKFKLAHFADLVRVKLLEKYGGLWLDSTILLTADIDEKFFHNFLSVKSRPVDNDSVSEYRWCSFVLGGG